MLVVVLGIVLGLGCRRSEVKPDAGALQSMLEKAKVPGIAIAVVRNGAVIRTESAGNVTNATPMEAASIAKTVIGIAAMQLVEAGKLGLDDDASACLGFDLHHAITIRMLLTHSSGIHDRPDLESARDPDLDAFLRGYVNSPDAFTGARHEYSNVGASLAALCIEKKSKQSFGAYARTRILEPLGTKATYRPVHAVYPVVDLFATAEDLGKLLASIERGGDPILSRASVDAMLDAKLGWQSIDLAGREVLGHEGEDRAASTAMFFDPKTKNGAVILTNGDAFASGDPARARALQDLLADLLR